jgi:hypothetical protein
MYGVMITGIFLHASLINITGRAIIETVPPVMITVSGETIILLIIPMDVTIPTARKEIIIMMMCGHSRIITMDQMIAAGLNVTIIMISLVIMK